MTSTSTRAYERLAASLRESILTGELQEGQRLPAETALAERAGVSRSTVREALRLLQEGGFLERVSPKILAVRAQGEAPAVRAMAHALRRRTVTFEALYESLMLFEPELSRLAALRRDEGDLEVLGLILDAQRAASDDFATWCRLDEQFHVAVAEASANAPLTLARRTLGRFIVPTVEQFVHSEVTTRTAIGFHERLYAEIANGEGELAAAIARRHIEDFRAAWERSGLGYRQEISSLVDGAASTTPSDAPPFSGEARP